MPHVPGKPQREHGAVMVRYKEIRKAEERIKKKKYPSMYGDAVCALRWHFK